MSCMYVMYVCTEFVYLCNACMYVMRMYCIVMLQIVLYCNAMRCDAMLVIYAHVFSMCHVCMYAMYVCDACNTCIACMYVHCIT